MAQACSWCGSAGGRKRQELFRRFVSDFVAPLRLAHIHRAVGVYQRLRGFRMRPENRDTRGDAGRTRVALEGKTKAVDVLLKRCRLGMRIGFAEVPQQQRKLVAAEPSD